jgi:predicted Zn-dependent protease with MMP-like domain
MTYEEFEKLVAKGIDAIPQKFIDLMDNVAVVVEDEPNAAQKKELNLGHGYSLFGLYEGVPLGKRANYSGALPDKITIFKKPIEKAARSPEEVADIVRDTVWHEIAHHFGMEEDEVFEAERKRSFKKIEHNDSKRE